MSDSGGLTNSAIPDVVAANIGGAMPAAAAEPPGGTPSSPPGGPADPFGDLPADQSVFSRGYVEQIRQEAQRYRGEAQTAAQAAKAYEEVFGIYEPDDRQVWMDLASTWAVDPARAAQVMQQIAAGVLGDGQAQGQDETYEEPPPSNGDVQLTEQQVAQMIAEQFTARDANQLEARLVNEIYDEVRAAGYDPDGDGFQILYDANHFTGGDIPKAIEMQRAREQRIIDNYVQGRSSGRVPMPTSGGVPGVNAPEPIKNLEDAHKAATAFLRDRMGAR